MSKYVLPSGASLYGNYRTRTFSDVFESAEKFKEEWESTGFSTAIETLNTSLIFSLLYARYGNSSVASSDENRFKYQLFSIIFQYAPTWAKELELQKEIRSKSIADFQLGSTNIVNNASNPSSQPTTQTLEELQYINQQNVSRNKRSEADAIALILSLLKEDVTEEFISKFKKLFLTIVEPERPLWYVNQLTEE